MLKKLNKEKGFTIIEVLIVLAIAGVIMLVVFLAVPALQRNSRNTQRRSDASHLAGVVNEYAANHAGQLPPDGATLVSVTSGEKFAIMSQPVAADWINGIATVGSLGTMKLNINAACDQTAGTLSAGSSARQFAITYQVEPGTTAACIQG